MRRLFVDTSAILTLLVPTDRFHVHARNAFERFQAEKASLVTSSYVRVETHHVCRPRQGPLQEGLAHIRPGELRVGKTRMLFGEEEGVP